MWKSSSPTTYSMDENTPLTYYIENYSDFCNLLMIKPNNSTDKPSSSNSFAATKKNSNQLKALLAYKTKYSLPKSVRYHSASSHLIENLMFRAVQHWCCISFKIVPIELELIKKDTPKSILYCVAAISMVTTTTTSQRESTLTTETNKNNKVKKVYDKSTEGFKKDVGFYFYERAVNCLKEVAFSDEDLSSSASVTAIQCYFCLSYTANLLRLTDEQRTWHYLACDQLKSKVYYINVSPALRQCWYRWYYIDAWIALSRNMECLLPDKLPFTVKRPSRASFGSSSSSASPGGAFITELTNNGGGGSSSNGQHTHSSQQQGQGEQHGNCCIMSNDTLYEFVIMTQYMRRFNRCIQSGTLVHSYDDLTHELEHWWANMEDANRNLHLAICYHSMRLVILFSLLQQSHLYYVDSNLLLDGLNITLEILQGLQELKLMNCDQSTYHYMFYAVHKLLKSILFHIKQKKEFQSLESFAKQQFEMNLCILEGTDAFMNDIYAMRTIGAMIEDDLYNMGYIEDEETNTKRSILVFRSATNTIRYSNKKKRAKLV